MMAKPPLLNIAGTMADCKAGTRPRTDASWKALCDGIDELKRGVIEARASESADALIELQDRSLVALERLRELRLLIERLLIDFIDSFGPIDVGDRKYVVSVARKIQCTDRTLAAEYLLDALSGDLGTFCEHLVAQPYKCGAVRSRIPDDAFRRCFKIIEKKGADSCPEKTLLLLPRTR